MNTNTGEIRDMPLDLRLALATARAPEAPTFQKLFAGYPAIIPRLEAKATGKCSYDAGTVAAEMMAKHEQGPLVELRGNPDPACPECKGKGAAGGGKGNDDKFHPCRCCAMPLYWCNTHNRQATELIEERGPDRGKPQCSRKLGGIAMPCACVDLTGIAELFTE